MHEPPVDTWTPREHQIYEIGYREGESSATSDWILALNEELDLEADGLSDAITKLKERLTTLGQSPSK